MRIRTGTAADAARIRSLLTAGDLPTSDLNAAAPHFVVAQGADGEIVATGALQRFGRSALLRSVAVTPQLRGTGLGSAIVLELEQVARTAHIIELILLTLTAKGFFERLGYRLVDRQSVPEDVRASEEFRSLCPASAVCMTKTISDS